MRPSIALFGLALTACYSTGEGIAPPLDRIYFPVGLSTDCDTRAGAKPCEASRLYVVSSDFDLQFNAGSIQALDLAVVRKAIPTCEFKADCCPGGSEDCTKVCDSPCGGATGCNEAPPKNGYTYLCQGDPDQQDDSKPCGDLGFQSEAEESLYPGACNPMALKERTSILPESVGIGAFATDVLLTTSLDPENTGVQKKRLLVPVRGESSLHWIDIKEGGKLDCGQTPESRQCNHQHRVGTDTSENTRNVKMPPEPYGIAASDEGDAIVITHQTLGQLSVFQQDPKCSEGDCNGWDAGPQLQYIHQLPASAAVAVAAAPEPLYVRRAREAWLASPPNTSSGPDPFPPGFLVAYANAAQIDLVRYFADASASPARPFVQEARTIYIQANSGGRVSRAVAFDDTERRLCDAGCSDGDQDCLKDCANQSMGVYVSSRSPASLLVASTAPWALESPSRDLPVFQRVVSVPVGASRIYVGKVLVDCDGTNEVGSGAGSSCTRLETRVFLLCFDQRRIVIYDPKRRRVEETIKTGRGPHAMAFDFTPGDEVNHVPPRALAYVAHFTDSYVGVVELDRRKIHSYATMVLSLATPVAPRSSK